MPKGEINIEMPPNVHLMLNRSASRVSGTGGLWQCLLCDLSAPTAQDLVKLPCHSPRIYTIIAEE